MRPDKIVNRLKLGEEETEERKGDLETLKARNETELLPSRFTDASGSERQVVVSNDIIKRSMYIEVGFA